MNELSAELYAITNTDYRITSAYHPQVVYSIQYSINETYFTILLQTNGLTERFNQSQCLAKVCNEDQTNWDEKLDTVLMGYRASCQAQPSILHTTCCFSSTWGSQLMLRSCLHPMRMQQMSTLLSEHWWSQGRKCSRRQRVTSCQLRKTKRNLWQKASASRNSSRNRGPTGKHSTKAEERWKTRTCMAWAICCPPLHWKRALWTKQRWEGGEEKNKYSSAEDLCEESKWRWHAS